MKTKQANELILMPKVFYTFKEFSVFVAFQFFVEVLEARKQTILFGLPEDLRSWSNSRAWFLIVGQNSEVKLKPNERSS